MSSGFLVSVDWHFESGPDTGDKIFSGQLAGTAAEPIGKYGYMAFVYPSGDPAKTVGVYGRLYWVNFKAQRFFPEAPNAVAVQFWIAPGISWSYRPNRTDAISAVPGLSDAIGMDLITGVGGFMKLTKRTAVEW